MAGLGVQPLGTSPLGSGGGAAVVEPAQSFTGQPRGWRFLTHPVDGVNPAQRPVELPFLSNVTITSKLSGPPQITATVPVEVIDMKDADGRPLLRPRRSALFVEDPNGELYGSILQESTFNGQAWDLDCAGFSFYPKNQPYVWDDEWIGVDPLAIHRHIWAMLQSLPYSNYGVEVETVDSPVRLGTPETMPVWEQVLRNAYFWESGPVHRIHVDDWLWGALLEAGWTLAPEPDAIGIYLAPPEDSRSGSYRVDAAPYALNWFSTFDCGQVIDTLATETPFDWVEEHWWGGDTIRHRIKVGYPRIGRRRNDLRFAVGENVIVIPTVHQSGEDYASNVLVLGQGEGRDRIAGDVAGYTDGPRHVLVIEDKTVTSRDQAVEVARRELARMTAPFTVADLDLMDHPNAPIGSIELGDEVWLEGWTGWADLAMWVRVVAVSIAPAKSDRISVTVERV